jgi:hypothetical protein
MVCLMSVIREWIEETGHEEIYLFDGLDDACIGIANRIGQPALAVYDWWMIVDVLMRDGIDDIEDAIEYLEFNIAGAWLGPNTPLILERPEWLHVERHVL